MGTETLTKDSLVSVSLPTAVVLVSLPTLAAVLEGKQLLVITAYSSK